MVWPILISVAVTPRISADIAAAGHASNASALTTPIPVTKRIGTPPFFAGALQMADLAGAVWPALSAKHAMTGGWTPIIIILKSTQKHASHKKNAALPPRF
jgi:hypothetical protein